MFLNTKVIKVLAAELALQLQILAGLFPENKV